MALASEGKIKPVIDRYFSLDKFIDEIVKYFASASVGEQGHLIESLEYSSKKTGVSRTLY